MNVYIDPLIPVYETVDLTHNKRTMALPTRKRFFNMIYNITKFNFKFLKLLIISKLN